MPETSTTNRRSCVEEVLTRFKDFTSELLKDVPELRSLSLVIDWDLGSSEFPHGLMLGRNDKLSLPELLGNTKQTQKLIETQVEMLGMSLAHAQKLVDKTSQD